jgi:hypothetical protein
VLTEQQLINQPSAYCRKKIMLNAFKLLGQLLMVVSFCVVVLVVAMASRGYL